MLYLTSDTKILLAITPIDFRKQLDSLISICSYQIKQDPRSGCLFVFINRKHTMIRVLCYENNGYWLATKRLSKGYFALWPKSNSEVVNKILSSELKKILKTSIDSRRKKL